MRKFIIGFVAGSILCTTAAFGLRVSKPPKINNFEPQSLAQLNNTLEDLWNITNGRYNLNIVTSNPDGSLKGDVGDVILFNNSGTYYLEVNTTGQKIWRGVQLSDTP